MDKRLKRTLSDLIRIPVMANLFGGLSIFIYLSYINVDRNIAVVLTRSGFLRGWPTFLGFVLIATLLITLFVRRYVAPLEQPIRRAARGEPVGPISDRLRHRALALPRTITLLSAVGWFVAGIFFSREAGSLLDFVENFFAISVVAGFPSLIFSYILLDLSWKRAIPVFFPDGDVPRYTTARLTVRNRLRIIMPLITYLPLALVIWIAFDRTRQLWITRNPALLFNMLISHIYVGFLSLVIIVTGLYSLARSVIAPLLELRAAFERVGKERDFTTRLPVVSNDEIGEVAADFNRMVDALAQGRRAEEERARIAQELELARRTQLSLLPREAPRIPYLEVAASSEPALHVGGDLYGYYLLTDSTLAITIGDVSGKGMAAALMMATTTGLIGANVGIMRRPAELLTHLNTAMRFHTQTSGLNTALCALHFSPNGRCVEVEAANAGSVWPILRRAHGAVEWLEVGGPPLGVGLPVPAYLSVTRSLGAGDLLVLSSDGVIEAQNRERELFGLERLEAAVSTLDTTQSAFALHAQLLHAVHNFIDGAEPHDDVTLIVLKVVWPDGVGK